MGIRPLILALAIVLSLVTGATAAPRVLIFNATSGSVDFPLPSFQMKMGAYNGLFNLSSSGLCDLGDFGALHNGTFIEVNDPSQLITLNGSVKVGSGGTTIAKILSTTTTWNPGNLVNGASEAKISISFPGIAVGDVITAALTTITSPFWTVQAVCSATDLAEVRITNNTGGTVDLASGTLRLNCIKF